VLIPERSKRRIAELLGIGRGDVDGDAAVGEAEPAELD
jgi:hypothetical protein